MKKDKTNLSKGFQETNSILSGKEYCIAVIAGEGQLPALIINRIKQQQKNFVVLSLNDSRLNSAKLEERRITQQCIGIEEIGKAFEFLEQNKVTQIVFAGKVRRPSLLSMKLNMKGLSLLGTLGIEILKNGGGDDKILSYVVKLLEKKGYQIIAPEALLPQLLMPSGVLGRIKPTKQEYKDIIEGQKVLAALGKSDVGQAVVVENGYVLGIEAAEGTDNLILRCGQLKKEKGGAGVLIKMKKSNQETRMDLPTIGIKTLLNVHKAGFKGIALESRSSLIIDIDALIKKANELKLFLIGVD